ncbi:MAG: CvpA family protein [Candidatus Micrarchaeia archaeon]
MDREFRLLYILGMNVGSIPWGWFDLIVVALLIGGVVRGRINGMSKELIPLLQWLAIAVGGAFGYKPLARYLAQLTMMDMLYCNVMSYVLIAVVVFMLVMSCKHTLERKLLGADSLGYQTIDGLVDAIGIGKENLCMACLNEEYPTPGAARIAKEMKGKSKEEMKGKRYWE